MTTSMAQTFFALGPDVDVSYSADEAYVLLALIAQATTDVSDQRVINSLRHRQCMNGYERGSE